MSAKGKKTIFGRWQYGKPSPYKVIMYSVVGSTFKCKCGERFMRSHLFNFNLKFTRKTGYCSFPSLRASARSPWTQTLRAPHRSVGMTWWWNSFAPDGRAGPEGFSSPDILFGGLLASSPLLMLIPFLFNRF